MTFGIVLCKPIPDEGRKPTARECDRFRNLRTNVLPTTSGAWRLGWIKRHGVPEPYLLYRGRNTSRASDGAGWTFTVLEPESKPETPKTPRLKPLKTQSHSDGEHDGPTWIW